MNRVFRALLLPASAAVVVLMASAGCGSSSDDESSTAMTGREASASVTCPNVRSGTNQLVIANDTGRDLTLEVSPPDCRFWSETGYPARYNGSVLPARFSGDPAFTRNVEASSAQGFEPVRMTFTGNDGSVVARVQARFDHNTRDTGIDVLDTELGDFVKTPVTVGQTPKGAVQAVGSCCSAFALTLQVAK
ncbi:MAG: hypothetical protein ACKORA_05715 [Solirubrobacterales bacterium]